MSWTRGLLAALAVCVVVLTGIAGCGSSDAQEQKGGESTQPVGKLLDHTDAEGRRYREVDGKKAPDVAIEVTPDADGSWDLRLTLRNFRFSAVGTKAEAAEGRGTVRLFVDGDPIAGLRTPAYRIPAGYLTHGTHHVTARLYADDGTVWAVRGKPVESTADITASEVQASPSGTSSPFAMSAPGTLLHTQGRGSPDPGGKAS